MRKQKTLYRIVVGLLCSVLVLSTAPIPNVSANTSDCDTDFYSSNDIPYYNPCIDSCSGTSSAIGDATLPSKTIRSINSAGVDGLIEQNRGRYDTAAQETGVPWQVIAALHYREALLDNSKSIFNGAELGSGINVDGQEVVADPNEDAINASNHFINMADAVYDVDVTAGDSLTINDWGEAFLAYNRGYLYKQNGNTYDQSPYVMNGFDSEHLDMSWVGAPADPAVSGVDGNTVGALAIIAHLGLIDPVDGCSGGGAVLGDIVRTALGYALETPVTNGTNQPSDARDTYREAMPVYNAFAAVYPQITDCGRFVSTVMRASGADPDYPYVLVSTQVNYMRASDKWQELGRIPISEMQPGDVITTSGHTIIFTGPNGEYMAADASFYQRVPSVRKIGGVSWMVSEGHNTWRLR